MQRLRPIAGTGWPTLYRAESARAVNLAYLLTGQRQLAEDLAQEAFVRVASRLREVSPDAFGPYLRQTVVNLARSHFRHARVQRRYADRIEAEAEHRRAVSEAASAIDADSHEELWRALHALPARQREVLVCRFYLDMSEEQTAETLGIRAGTVKSTSARGLVALRAALRLGAGVVMDDLERDLSELLQQRVAALPDQYEAPPALVGRARRRRTLKRVSLVVSVVVIATGTAAGVAQVAGRQHPHHVITTLPPPSTTSTTATLPASTSTSTSPPRPRVATVACPITYILTGETPYPAPVIEPRVPQAGDRTLLGHLTSFAATTDPRYVVLAPTGWTCAMTAATDGQNGMDVQPPGAAPGSDPGSTGGIAIINDYLWHGGVGSTLACTVFDDPALVQYVTQNYPGQLPCPSAGRTVTRVDTHVATFVDPDGTHGVGVDGAAVESTGRRRQISILRCKPTVGLTTADCDTIIADFIVRQRCSGWHRRDTDDGHRGAAVPARRLGDDDERRGNHRQRGPSARGL